MTTTALESLPITEVQEPADEQELAAVVRGCFTSGTPVYPLGGGTSLDYGLPAKREGVGLSLAKLNRIVDYPARDMTITVEAGATMESVAAELSGEAQRLPLDVPFPDKATLGGVVATNFNGPRRYGEGSVRDYVIGIRAVDGRGMPFQGGGRVVKNVAGYDFCKLLTGSLGTLGVITQLTMRLKPAVESLAVMVACPADLEEAEQRLADLVHSETYPSAIELLAGPAWQNDAAFGAGDSSGLFLLVALEGTRPEVRWMTEQLGREWQRQGLAPRKTVEGEQAEDLMGRLADFPAAEQAPLVLKASVPPSRTTRLIAAARELDPGASIQSHAGNGVVIVRLSEFPANGLSRALVGHLHPIAAAAEGSVVILSNPSRAEMTHQSVWGGIDVPFGLMGRVKEKFDPENILNPDRFVYHRLENR